MSKLRVEQKFPFLRNYSAKSVDDTDQIAFQYKKYVRNISSAEMAISLETALFIHAVCAEVSPRQILDLGSGFSSYVFRRYAATANEITVWSVDDNPYWLEQTRVFLQAQGLSTDHLILWKNIDQYLGTNFDLIFHDLGNMELRKNALPLIFEQGVKGNSIILLDDIHKTRYRRYVHEILVTYTHRYSDLKSYTRDTFGRYCGIVMLDGRRRKKLTSLWPVIRFRRRLKNMRNLIRGR